jgi:hypothetical protein
LPLFVLGVALANDADDALSLDDLAVLANRLNAGTNLHTSLLAGFLEQQPNIETSEGRRK